MIRPPLVDSFERDERTIDAGAIAQWIERRDGGNARRGMIP